MDTHGSEHADCPVRVVNIYATPWRLYGKYAELREDEGTPTDLGGLDLHYELYKEQLPRQLPDRLVGSHLRLSTVALARADTGVTVENAKAELFVLPSKQVVLAVTMCLTNCALADEGQADLIAQVLEQGIAGDIRIDEQGAGEALRTVFQESPAREYFSTSEDIDAGQVGHGRRQRRYRRDDGKTPSDQKTSGRSLPPLLPERHQLVFVAKQPQDSPLPTPAVIDKILYRKTPPYRPEFVSPRLPKQLNSDLAWGPRDAARKRRLTAPRGLRRADADGAGGAPTLDVVTPYVSLLYGHRDYVEASIRLSTVQAVGTAARFRHIWREAYQRVSLFREKKLKSALGQQTRDDLEVLADGLGNLEFDLTFSVEFPLMPIETFQSDLYDAMDLHKQARTLGQMFNQIGGSLRSEITAIEARERRQAEHRRGWNSFAIGLLTFIGVTVGFVITFLGVNTTDVPDSPKVSMWDPQFAVVYLIASSFAVTAVYLIAFPYLEGGVLHRAWRGVLWWGVPTALAGLAIFGGSLVFYQQQTGVAHLVAALAIAPGAFFALVGLTFIVLWAWRLVRDFRRRKQDRHDNLTATAGAQTGR